MEKFDVKYFRYADDMLIMGIDYNQVVAAEKCLEDHIQDLGLEFKGSHHLNISWGDASGFQKQNNFTYLGLVYTKDGITRFATVKQRKIIRFVRSELQRAEARIRRATKLSTKIEIAVECVSNVLNMRIRDAAIVDYYLKHTTDEEQLRNMDTIIIEMMVSTILEKRFRRGLFRIISPKMLRDAGLQSLVHRHRLIKHGHIKVSFLSLRDELRISRYMNSIERYHKRVKQLRLGKKLKAMGIEPA